jgi:hypothetical protein
MMSSKKIITKADIDEIIKNKSNDLNSINLKNLKFSKYPTYTLNSPLKKYLPYTLNSKLFSKLALLILASFIFQNNSDAATAKLPKPKINILRQTEATTCIDCATRAPQSSLSEYLAQLPIVKDGFARVYDATYFDDGNDKQAIIDLRIRRANGETLTAEENAILQAASRTGSIYMCKGASSNATLIQIDGRDAIITTAHALIDPKTGKPKCKDYKNVSFYPNLSFYDNRNGDMSEFEKRAVMTDGTPPLNLENVIGQKTRVKTEQDFLIFFLDDQKKPISQEALPDKTVRGFMKFNTTPNDQGKIYLLGLDPQFRNGLATSYQQCDYKLSAIKTGIYHTCDTIKGTSSSVLATMKNNELMITGIHQQGTQNTESLNPDYTYWNLGGSMSNVTNYLKKEDLTN